MSEQNTVILGALVGAACGAVVSFMYFTENGRQWRQVAERNLAELAGEAERLIATVEQVRQGVAELRSGEGAATGWSRSA